MRIIGFLLPVLLVAGLVVHSTDRCIPTHQNACR